MSTTAGSAPPSTNLRDDAGLIGLVGLAHLVSHFSQLLLAPLFPWLKEAFNASYIELGFLMTLFFTVSCAVQTAAGFLVDRFGPRPILFSGLALLGLTSFGFGLSPNYWTMALFSVLAGVGNGVFHPANYTLLNRKVSAARLGHAYSVHGITGSLGWALAPAVVVPLAIAFSWRVALMTAGTLAFVVLAVLLLNRRRLDVTAIARAPVRASTAVRGEGSLDFLRIPAVWMCFGFFFFYALVLSVIQAFAPESARQLHGVPMAAAAMCLTLYMICSAGGMIMGGFLAADPARCEIVVGLGFGLAALIALVIGVAPVPGLVVPPLFGLMGFAAGIAAPSRDLLVKRSTPENATGRVYGVVYSALDIGQAISPLIFGVLMDRHQYRGIWLGLVVLQAVLITSAFNVRRVRRTVLAAA
ncbi:MAG TPA: MFS transporter [Ramlibacter sp.]|nr:MFS transporter [Ramlibacter sp.]